MRKGITVTARDNDQLVYLVTRHPYARLAAEVGCARQTMYNLAHDPGRALTLQLAQRIEQQFGYDPGGLFQLAGADDPELAPYLPTGVAA